MDFSKMNIVELKAMAYDQLATMENIQKNLGLINQEIIRRLNVPKVESNG